jgi:hypothetical protein
MQTDFSIEMVFVLCVLAVWRVTHFFVAEDGPWDIVVKLRVKAGDSFLGQMMDCFYCMSVWVSALFAFFPARNFWGWVLCWLALSGAASLLERGTQNNTGE